MIVIFFIAVTGNIITVGIGEMTIGQVGGEIGGLPHNYPEQVGTNFYRYIYRVAFSSHIKFWKCKFHDLAINNC